ncbi:hypothetical protein ACJVC5_15865 [Peredibacter sp. HCB2-198]|uniref:hypothetical protein n=1 Tax=Peredibacter sp. HCB2-198 TaxID=3383025 RepID=UPI0038B4264F
MKILFLVFTFLALMLTGYAQRQPSQYTCQASHKHSEVAFTIDVGTSRIVDVGGWDIKVGLMRSNKMIEVSVSRTVNVLDATYRREAKRSYSLNARALPVELAHDFGGKQDVFNVICYPRN